VVEWQGFTLIEKKELLCFLRAALPINLPRSA